MNTPPKTKEPMTVREKKKLMIENGIPESTSIVYGLEISRFAEAYLKQKVSEITDEEIEKAAEYGLTELMSNDFKGGYMKGFYQGIKKWFIPEKLLNSK